MDYKTIMNDVWKEVQGIMPEHIQRLSWSKEQVAQYQTKALRELLKVAKENTKYYSEVLSDVDVDNFNISS